MKTDMVYLVNDGFWLTVGQLFVMILGFVLTIMFANLLPKEVYGNYKFILSFSGILGALTLTGMGPAITRAAAKGYDGMLQLGFSVKLKWSIFVFIAGLLSSSYYFINGNSMLGISLLIAGSLSPFLSSFALYAPFLQGKRKFKEDAIFNIVRNAIPALSLSIVLLLTKNPILIIFTYFLSHTIIAGLLYFATIHKYQSSTNTDGNTINYSKHLSIMNILNVVAMNIDKVLIFHYLGTVELAIYAFATLLPEQIKTLIKTVGSLAFPKFAQQTHPEIKRALTSKMMRFGLILIIIVACYIFAAPVIYKLLFPQYTDSILYSQLFALSLITSVTILPMTALQAQAKKMQLYTLNIVTSVFQIVTLFVLIAVYGLMGAIVARIISRFIIMVMTIAVFNNS